VSDYYTITNLPATLTKASSQVIRDQFVLTNLAFDKLPALTGAGDEIVFVNSAGTALISKDAATARTALDAQQQFDALDSIGGLTTLADRMIYTTALDTYAVATLTAVARTLLAAATVVAQRNALGLGTSDSPSFAGLTLGGVPVSLVSYNWGAVITADQDLVAGAGHMVNTAGGDVTLNLPSSMTVGDVFTIHHIDPTDSGNTCRVGENGNSITFKGEDEAANVTLERGETNQLVATGTNTAEIV